MADFIPVSFTKDGITEIAYTQSEYVQYVFDGWILGDPAPPDVNNVNSVSIKRVEVVDVLPDPNPDNAGTLFFVTTN
jgi:hypothetical protein